MRFSILEVPIASAFKNAAYYRECLKTGLSMALYSFPMLCLYTLDVAQKHARQVFKAFKNFQKKTTDYALRLLAAFVGTGIGYVVGLPTLLVNGLIFASVLIGSISLFNSYRKKDPILFEKGFLIPALWVTARYLPIIGNLCNGIICSNLLYNTSKCTFKWYEHYKKELKFSKDCQEECNRSYRHTPKTEGPGNRKQE